MYEVRGVSTHTQGGSSHLNNEELFNIEELLNIEKLERTQLYARDGKIWLNQQQMAELFATSKSNISMHIAGVLKDRELDKKISCSELLNNCRRR